MMHASLLIVGLALTQTAPPASVAPSAPTPKKPGVVVERVESTVAGIVAQGTEIRRLAEGQLFTEGPACDAAGVLYWTDIPRNELMRLAPDGKPEVALEKTEGLNGLAFASDGTLYGCAGGSGRIVKIDLAAPKTARSISPRPSSDPRVKQRRLMRCLPLRPRAAKRKSSSQMSAHPTACDSPTMRRRSMCFLISIARCARIQLKMR